MTTQTKWRIVWASWLAAGAVAETIALLGGHDHAPLSHHMRQHTSFLGKHNLGGLLLLGVAVWLHHHLYGSGKLDPLTHLKNGGQAKSLRK